MNSVILDIKQVRFVEFEDGEDILKSILNYVNINEINCAVFYGIGAVKKAEFGFYDGNSYKTISKNENLEIISCIGNISLDINTKEKIVHCHIVFGDNKGNAYGGHLLEGCIISPTLELTMFELKGELFREFDEKTKLKLIKM